MIIILIIFSWNISLKQKLHNFNPKKKQIYLLSQKGLTISNNKYLKHWEIGFVVTAERTTLMNSWVFLLVFCRLLQMYSLKEVVDDFLFLAEFYLSFNEMKNTLQSADGESLEITSTVLQEWYFSKFLERFLMIWGKIRKWTSKDYFCIILLILFTAKSHSFS